MATDTSTGETSGDSTTGTSTGETSGQEQQGQQQSSTGETSGQEQQQEPAKKDDEKPVKLPDDHPLVKTLAAQKAELAEAKTELTDLRTKSAKVTKLEEELGKRPTQETVDTLQKRNERLEAFLGALGGPISRALDSKSFTTQLFESETDIKTIVKDFAAANPTATSSALGAGAAAPASGAPDMNTLLRKAKG